MKHLFQKSLVTLAIFTCSSTAFAAADGFYIEGQAGWSKVYYKPSTLQYMNSASVNNSGFGYRPSFGYQVNKNFAAEVGYTHFKNANYQNISMNPNPAGVSTLGNGAVDVSAWDIAAKGMLPLSLGFGAFAKAGIAYEMATRSGSLNFNTLGADYTSQKKWVPEAGAGFSYDFSQNVIADISYNHLFPRSNLQAADLTSIGLGYHFG